MHSFVPSSLMTVWVLSLAPRISGSHVRTCGVRRQVSGVRHYINGFFLPFPCRLVQRLEGNQLQTRRGRRQISCLHYIKCFFGARLQVGRKPAANTPMKKASQVFTYYYISCFLRPVAGWAKRSQEASCKCPEERGISGLHAFYKWFFCHLLAGWTKRSQEASCEHPEEQGASGLHTFINCFFLPAASG